MNTNDNPYQVTYLDDYQPNRYVIEEVNLTFNLAEKETQVESKLYIKLNDNSDENAPLVLHGEELKLDYISLDGSELLENDYDLNENSLVVKKMPNECEIVIKTTIYPDKNTSLSGLYRSNHLFCTQCEAEGFRRITYFLDRPDNLTKFTTKIIASKNDYPVLLSNGNKVDYGDLNDGRHWVKWVDPFKKPAYLFALVAGNLHCTQSTYHTTSGKEVTLELYVEHRNKNKTSYALASLEKAMRWDENTFNLEYDLERYMIVAVDDFNMGAMENKGLNIFNSKYVLANIETATDDDFESVESVIGHEYFHNWSGNRVTCRDWFQLSLKEGLTVFREQLFSADCGNAIVKRIRDVNLIRARQFSEDAGPLAHPVRPKSYIEINNFYTMTIYYKGSEVIRMLDTLLGREGFKKGLALYFERHDGQAVTIDDFIDSMEKANNKDLTQFKRWYFQAGTPQIKFKDNYDNHAQCYTLEIEQYTPETADGSEKNPFLIPIRFSLIDSEGKILISERILELTESKQKFKFENVASNGIPSLFGGFSAPVKMMTEQSDENLLFKMTYDTDLFNRWDSAQKIYTQIIIDLYHGRTPNFNGLCNSLINVFKISADRSLLAEMLTIPSFENLMENIKDIDPLRLNEARNTLKRVMSENLKSFLKSWYDSLPDSNADINGQSIANRHLKNVILYYLMYANPKDYLALCEAHFHQSKNMTDRIGALTALNNHKSNLRDSLLNTFYETWKEDPLVVNKWFGLHAHAQFPDCAKNVKKLIGHSSFSINNPNNVFALIRAFASNPIGFHHSSGVGYELLTEVVLRLNKSNPQLAARILEPLTMWKKFSSPYKELMKQALNVILIEKQLSNDVYEITYKSLKS